jgi:uncharacterized membrane protein YvbJ
MKWTCPACGYPNRPKACTCGQCGAREPMATAKPPKRPDKAKDTHCHPPSRPGDAAATKGDLEKVTKRIMAKLSTLATTLIGVKDQLEKGKQEILARIENLETALADVDLPAEAETALEALKTSAQGIDDINPDAPTPA